MSTNYTIVITQDRTLIFSGYFIVDNTASPNIIAFYEDGNATNILAPVGSFGNNNNVFGSIYKPFINGVNITTMSYYAGDYGSNNFPPPNGDGTYNLYDFIRSSGSISNFGGLYQYMITNNTPICSYYKINIAITLDTTPIFNGFFVINNNVYPNIIGFYEDGSETTNILAPVGSFGGNDNVFNTLTNPFINGVNITTMSYYAGDYGSNNVPPPNGDGTYNLFDFNSSIGYIANFESNSYNFTTTLADPNDPIPLYPVAPVVPIVPIVPVVPVTNNPITYIVCEPYQKSRFCYNYKPQGVIQPCCTPIVCATDEYISSLSSIPAVVNNSSRTTESSLLQATVKRQQQEIQTQHINRTVESTITNAAAINENIFSQLVNIRNERYAPYQPYIYPVVPPSVMELQMRTANVGVPHTFNTIANCKGSQFVTT